MHTVQSYIQSVLYETVVHVLLLSSCMQVALCTTQSIASIPTNHHHFLNGVSQDIIAHYNSSITSSSFIHLLFYSQSCCTVTMMAEVLSSACAGTTLSQLSALLSLRRNLLLSHDERPSSMLKGVEDSLNSLSKVPGHLPTLMIYGCCRTQLGKVP